MKLGKQNIYETIEEILYPVMVIDHPKNIDVINEIVQYIEEVKKQVSVEPGVIKKITDLVEQHIKVDEVVPELTEYLNDKQVYDNYGRSFMLPDDAETVAGYLSVYVRKKVWDMRSELKQDIERNFSL